MKTRETVHSAPQPKHRSPFFSKAKNDGARPPFFQTKPRNGDPGDRFARDADVVAEPKVSHGTTPRVLRMCSGCADEALSPDELQRQAIEEEEEGLQADSDVSLQRQSMEEEEAEEAPAADVGERPAAVRPKPTARRTFQGLRISEPHDPLEQEADRVADTVMRMQNADITGDGPVSIQRMCTECERESDLHRQVVEEEREEPGAAGSGSGGGGVPVADTASLPPQRGGGKPLSTSEHSFFGSRFGTDFSNVRLHADDAASTACRDVRARAFTYGSDIYFAKGEYGSGSTDSRRLLAHELTHVVQQGAAPRARASVGASGRGTARRGIVRAHSQLQRQAENLRSTRFSGNRTLERAFDNRTTVRQTRNRTGAHVTLIQQSLVAQGYALPVHGVDGIFGPETEAAVRAFQVDTGAVLLDGVVGPETMRLLDMHDPGGTTGVPGAGPPPAIGAVFSEAATEQFAGYDNSTAPDWLVVPVSGRRRADVAIAPAGANPLFVSSAPGVATVARTRAGIVVTGVSHGTAVIQARQGAVVLDRLRVSVKNRVDRSVAFHYVCDSRPAAAGGPHCSNGAPPANTMRSLLNRVWHRQANVRFTGGASHNVVVPGNLGAAVDWTTGLPGGGEWATVIATGTGAYYNVFRVWRYMQDGVWPNDAANLASNTLIGDHPCADGWGLPHECGHRMGLNHGHGFIMTPCGGRVNQRVSKAMADVVNP